MTQIKSSDINSKGHLLIDGVDSTELVENFHTPIVAYNVSQIREQIHHFKTVFEKAGVNYQISYASKAFATVAMYQLIKQEDIHCDVVSGGEMYTAYAAGFPLENASFHGNNKSDEELMFALQHHIGCIIIDNFYELERLEQLTAQLNQDVDVQLRITPGISAHTHQYDMTGQEDSKFGFDLKSGQAEKALAQTIASSHLKLMGIHCHIGSQIFAVEGFVMAAKKMMDLIVEWMKKYDCEIPIVNLGGGFGIRYTEDEHPLAPETFVEAIIDEIKKVAAEAQINVPEIWIEPGRSVVGNAGTSLYTIGAKKEIPGVRTYLSVDGGMGDNIRPALYQAKYEAVLANKMNAPLEQTVTVAGKYCESGDILIEQQKLPKTVPGDILAILDCGAYGYSMASNYNRNGRPAVVFCEKGQFQLVVKPESWQDMISHDLPLEKN
ncbi:diaminopimelate decarboxylase [Paucilactobacillus sp. N302-9]